MTVMNSIIKKGGTLALAAGVIMAGATASALTDPAENAVIHGGSAGFVDLYALSEEGRDNSGGEKSAISYNAYFESFGKVAVTPDLPWVEGLATASKPTSNFDSIYTEVDFLPIWTDANGAVAGLATLSVYDPNSQETRGFDADVREVFVTGRAFFSETATKVYSLAAAEEGKNAKGDSSAEFLAYGIDSVRRQLHHRVSLRGNSVASRSSVSLNLRDDEVFNFYQDEFATRGESQPTGPADNLTFTGTLNTGVRYPNGRRGANASSKVVVTGFLDAPAVFFINPNTVTVNTRLTKWVGDARLLTPFDLVADGDIDRAIPGGRSVLSVAYYNILRNRPGRYTVNYSNKFGRVPYRCSESGYLLNTYAEGQEIFFGDRALTDQEFRDRTFSFRTPASSTVVRATYMDEEILRRFEND